MTRKRVIGFSFAALCLALLLFNPTRSHFRAQIVNPVLDGIKADLRASVGPQLSAVQVLAQIVAPAALSGLQKAIDGYWNDQAAFLTARTLRTDYYFLSQFVLDLEGCRTVALGALGRVWLTQDGCGLGRYLDRG